jgi:hypothetical protein
MPESRPFIDAQGRRGRPNRAPISTREIHVNSPSRSLNAASHDAALSRTLRCEIRATGYLHIDLSAIINDGKIKIAKTYAIKLAKWILEEYNGTVPDTKEAIVARKSKGNRRIPPITDAPE